MKKSVRFSELSFIQESEEDDHGEVTLAVPNQPRTSVSPKGVRPSTSLPSRPRGAAADAPRRPTSCPFGDRNVQSYQNETEGKTVASPSKEELELKFPQNIILLQEQEKAKAAKTKKTGGINPSAGKDRGSSFIIARNYLYDVTDNSDKFLPRGLCSQPVSFAEVQTSPSSTDNINIVTSSDNLDNRFTDDSLLLRETDAPADRITDSPDVISSTVYHPSPVSGQVGFYSSCQEHQRNVSNPILQQHLAASSSTAAPLYSPSQILTSTVNPFAAPSNQKLGSVAYDLKTLPHDNFSQVDVLASSRVNQYLHSSHDQTPPVTSPNNIHQQESIHQNQNHHHHHLYSPAETSIDQKSAQQYLTDSPSAQQAVIYSDGAAAAFTTSITTNGDTDTPSLQFLRQNFADPVPISNEKLFHVTPFNTSSSRPTLAHPFTSPSNPSSPSNRQPVTSHAHDVQLGTRTQLHTTSHYQPTSSSSPTSVPVIGPIVVSPRKQALPNRSPSPTPGSKSEPLISSITKTTPATKTKMSVLGGGGGGGGVGAAQEIYCSSVSTSQARVHEKEELQRLSDRFTNYVSRVRQLGQEYNSVDTSAFLRSTKILEDEIVTLKTMYEKELEALRKEIEYNAQERNSLHAQVNKHHVSTGELQDRLSIETDKTSKLLDEINTLQRKIANLEAEIQDIRLTSQRPRVEIDQMQRTIENLTREAEQWKHRYEHENLARQEIEDKFQQIRKKIDFSDQVQCQQISDYQSRLDTSSATILSLEAKVRELSTADVTVAEMLKQVRDTAESELRQYQIESDEQYSRNLTALKAQIDHDADALQRFQTEKSELMGTIGELHAKIRNVEGQVANMTHQKLTLEEAISMERNRSADNIRHLEIKLRDVQDLLVVKMREVTNARESSIPLKAEIEMLKALLEEEERRLRIPLGLVSASVVQPVVSQCPTTSQILTSSVTNQILKPATPTNTIGLFSAQPTAVGYVGNQQYGDALVSRSMASAQAGMSANNNVLQTATISSPSSLPPLTRVINPTCVTFSDSLPHSPHPPASDQVKTSSTVYTGGCGGEALSQQNAISANFNYSSPVVSNSGFANPLYPYVPSPPLNTLYIPESLQSVDDEAALAYDAEYGCGISDYEMYPNGISFPMSGPRYLYEATPSVNRLHVDPSPPISPHLPVRAKSAPVPQEREACKSEKTKQKNIDLISTKLGNGQDYFDEMFNDLQKETVFAKPRPKSSPLERPLPSTFHDYTVSTSSAIGDLKILEVNQDGKFVRLLNDGPCEMEFGGYMIQQNVGGHPVAVFRFPPRTKFAPDSTVTVWASMSDPLLHNPPSDFFWKEQQKWGTGPECTTILCRANGQAVAWTTAAHRFTKDAFQENATDADDEGKYSYNKKDNDDTVDDDTLTELNIDSTGPKPEPVYLRREKQQPPSLVAPKHPHGSSPSTTIHPHNGQQRPLRFGNDNSSVNRQSRTQSTRPDPIPGQPYSGAPAQRLGSAPLRMFANNGPQPVTIRTNGTLANKSSVDIGETSDCPSPFMRPHSRFKSGLEQVQSQHHPDFLPPMPRPPHTSW